MPRLDVTLRVQSWRGRLPGEGTLLGRRHYPRISCRRHPYGIRQNSGNRHLRAAALGDFSPRKPESPTSQSSEFRCEKLEFSFEATDDLQVRSSLSKCPN